MLTLHRGAKKLKKTAQQFMAVAAPANTVLVPNIVVVEVFA